MTCCSSYDVYTTLIWRDGMRQHSSEPPSVLPLLMHSRHPRAHADSSRAALSSQLPGRRET
eukprot:6188967-Pleurochrysis_carterae.AAC.1